MHSSLLSALALVVLGPLASAQWIGYRAPGTPQTRDGKIDMAARAPRTRDGKPDLSGVWHVQTTSRKELEGLIGKAALDEAEKTAVVGMELDTISKYGVNILFDFPPDAPMLTPQGLAIMQSRAPGGKEVLPSEYCMPVAFPLATTLSEFHKIIQAPGVTMMLLELDNAYRQIYTDGRPLPKDPQPSWYGYSVGKWQGDTFVVETNGLNSKAWMDIFGHPRSESMKMTERYRRRDYGHLDVEITFDDPKMYLKPFTVKLTHELQPDTDVLEYICTENEKDTLNAGKK